MEKKKKETEKPTVKVGKCKDFEIVIQICFKKQDAVMDFLRDFFIVNQEKRKIKCPKCGNKNAEVGDVAGAYLKCNKCGYTTEELE